MHSIFKQSKVGVIVYFSLHIFLVQITINLSTGSMNLYCELTSKHILQDHVKRLVRGTGYLLDQSYDRLVHPKHQSLELNVPFQFLPWMAIK